MMRFKKLWLATIAALWCSMTVSAQEEFEVDDILYITTSSSKVEVIGYWGEKDVVVIPSTVVVYGTESMFQEPTITIYRVTSIGSSVFYDCSNLTSITIPASVTSIGDDAFYGCENLKTVINYSALDITKGSTDNGYVGYYAEHVIDRSVDEFIDDYAFTTIDGVHFLSCYVGVDRELRLPNNYRGEKYQIGEFAFYNCNQFTSITIPKGVTGIGESAFEGCGGELTVNCNIPSGAFRRSNFDKVVIGESVTSIGSSAFYDCSSLTAITLPKSVTSIGESAFEGCGGELTVNCNIPSGAFRRSNFDKVVIGESVTSIGEKAFEGCSNIASIICFATIPPTIEGSDAFPDVDKSIPIYVPNSEYLNADGWKEFTNFRFESPTFRQGRCGSDLTWRLTYDGELFIEGTGEMEGYCLPVPGILSWQINLPPWYGYDVERVTINEGVTSIGGEAFCGVNLSYIILPKSLTYIAYDAFGNSYAAYQSYIKTIINYSDLNILNDYNFHVDKVINVDEFIDGYAFKTIDGVHHLTDYIGNDTELALPEDCHDADYVIAESAFQGNEDIVSVKIPQTVGSIGNRAFYGCSSLTSVDFKEDVKSIGSEAFYGTAWYNNQPDGELYIGKVLYKYKGTMPANTSIEVKEGVISISGSAFYDCSSLTSITIPASVTSIGDDAFYGCENLKMVINYSDYFTIEKGSSDNGCVGYYADRVINVDEVVDGYAFNENELVAYLGNDTELLLPNGYHGEAYRIGEYAFYGRSNLTSITIPASVTSIGERAFYDCSSLTSITIPEGVTSIGYEAFYGCENLNMVINFSDYFTIEKGSSNNGYVGNYADRVVNADEIIDGYMFKTIDGVHSLVYYIGDETSLVLPEDYQGDDYVIAESAFQGNKDIVSVKIPQTVGSIGESAFADCANLASVEMARGVMSIEDNAFVNCTSLVSVVIPQNMRSIGYRAFYGCSSLTSITIPEGVTSIGDEAFYGCENLNMVINYSDYFTIEKGSSNNGYVGNYADRVVNADKIIDDYAFKTIDDVHHLIDYIGNDTELALPENYQDDDYVIGEMAFQGNEAIVSVEIPQTVGAIGNRAFAGCINLASVEMARGVMSIEEKAFENCISLSSVVIPQNMRTIGNSAFAGCSSLASVVFKEGVKSIGNNAFENCTVLTEIVIPESLTAIGAGAFKNCCGVASIIVGKEVESIGEGAFEGCTAVKTLIVRGSVMPTIPSSALTTIVLYSPIPLDTEEFANKVYRNATLYVRNGSLARFQSADVWENFWTIKEFDHTQEAITLDQTEVTLTEGESITLTATVTLEFMADMAVTWSTSDALVVTVDDEGTITAHAAGTAIITAMAGGMTATCEITVIGDTTDIEKSEIRNQNPEIIYDLQGRRVLNVENIKAGIYIVNGRKILIK